jgi:hypothetical protein
MGAIGNLDGKIAARKTETQRKAVPRLEESGELQTAEAGKTGARHKLRSRAMAVHRQIHKCYTEGNDSGILLRPC